MDAAAQRLPTRSVTPHLRRFVTDALRAGLPVTVDRLTQTGAKSLWTLAANLDAHPRVRMQPPHWEFQAHAKPTA